MADDMLLIESLLFWIAVTSYAAAFAAGSAHIAFLWKKGEPARLWALRLAWGFQLALLLYRGAIQFSPPIITYFESVHFGCWIAAGIYLTVRKHLPPFSGTVLALINLLLLGSSALAPRTLATLPPGLQSWWLIIHVSFALTTFGTLAVGTGAASAMLLKLNGFPNKNKLEKLLIQCLSFAFLTQMVMIASGAVWAKKAWGRYWGIDPIETFSLLTWIAYGAALHLNKTFGWRGNRLAWMVVIALGLSIYGIWGVPFFFKSMHLYEVQ